jgi:hypothetical protein
MNIAKKKMLVFQIMYARSSYAIMRAQILSLCKVYARLSCAMHTVCQYAPIKLWNNILYGIFLTVLKLFVSWNIIPCLSTNDGIMVFQLFQAASTKGGIKYSIIPPEAKDKAKN